MSYNPNQNREYILAGSEEGSRLSLEHKIFKANFLKILQLILDEYGLAQQLEKHLEAGTKAHILDLGCGEGLYLHDLAAVLEERGLLQAARLAGIDFEPKLITTAEEFAEISSPPRPYLSFYLHDLTSSLEECRELQAEQGLLFDFIYLHTTLEFLPQAKSRLQHFYQYLAPGGVIYTRSLVTTKGAEGWLSVHPVIEPFGEIIMSFVASTNQGVDVATQTAGWLEELGASQVEAILHKVPVGGSTQTGIDMLRLTMQGVQALAPQMIRYGAVTQAQYEEMLATMFREFGPHLLGQRAYLDTVARKP